MTAMLEVSGLIKRFGPITAVDGISFHMERGEVLGFLGPNGAGKSTTMKMITGFLRPDAGSITVCDYDVVADPLSAKRSLGYLPEGAPLYPDMTPRQILKFISEIRALKGAACEAADRARDQCGSYSGGSRSADRDPVQGLQAPRRSGAGYPA